MARAGANSVKVSSPPEADTGAEVTGWQGKAGSTGRALCGAEDMGLGQGLDDFMCKSLQVCAVNLTCNSLLFVFICVSDFANKFSPNRIFFFWKPHL